MKTTNINKQAMKLAWLLLRINNVMTSKNKTFGYFLRIAYKMLRNNNHFAYVLRGISNIKKRMRVNDRVTAERFRDFVSLYKTLRNFSPLEVRIAVTW